MNIFTLMLLGALQGLLEWIPVSSQGVITLILTLLGSSPNEAVNYAIFLHAGTMLAALIHYRHEFKEMLTKGTLLRFTVTVTLLTLVIGVPLYLFLENASETGGLVLITLIGIALIITGSMQLKKKKAGVRHEPNRTDSIITGLAQGASIIPGISRSGMTTSTLLFRGFKGETAIKLSFILSVPAVLVAEIGLQVLKGSTYAVEGFWGLIPSFLVGLLGIKAMTALARKINFGKFCILIGILMTSSAVLRFYI